MAEFTANTENRVKSSVNFAKLVKQTYGRNSLTRSAKDTIAQFPVVMSSDIPLEDATIIAKGLEAQYAALLVGEISMRSEYNRDQYATPADYLKTFHNNDNIPALFRSMDSELPQDIAELKVASATLTDLGKMVPKEVVMECWGNSDGIGAAMFNTDSLNGTYTPHAYTQGVMESVVSDLRKLHAPAMEADADSLVSTYTSMNAPKSGHLSGVPEEFTRRQKFDKNTGKKVSDDTFRKKQQTGKVELASKNQKFMSDLEPTLISVQLNSWTSNSDVITHNLVYGVKTKIQVIPQEYIISNLVEGVRGSRAIFTFIRWTEGDYKLIRDGILGFERGRTDAVANRDIRTWLNAIRARRRSDGYSKALSGQGLPPITTVVISAYEAARVAQETGVDLTEPYSAAKLIAKYYLLGFVIVNTETGTLSCMFDGDTQFSTTTIGALRQKQKNSNETDLDQFARMMRALGR